jgi:beta-xylosidase
VTWKDGWPLIGQDFDGNGVGEPVSAHRKPAVSGKLAIATPQTSDEFDDSKLGFQWQWHANHEEDRGSLSAREGWLRLMGRPMPEDDLAKTPHLLLQKLPARAFEVETRVDASELSAGRAGLAVVGKKHAALTVEREGEKWVAVLRLDNQKVGALPLDGPVATLRLTMRDGGACAFAIGERRFDQTFQAVEGMWIGAKVGVYCASPKGAAHADFDYFRLGAPK